MFADPLSLPIAAKGRVASGAAKLIYNLIHNAALYKLYYGLWPNPSGLF